VCELLSGLFQDLLMQGPLGKSFPQLMILTRKIRSANICKNSNGNIPFLCKIHAVQFDALNLVQRFSG
jgi:hypothetical protein